MTSLLHRCHGGEGHVDDPACGAIRAQESPRRMYTRTNRVQCGLTIAKLEAQLAEYLAFMERFRSSLKHEEQEL